METLDPATEWLRLSEHYRQMTDDELLALGRQISEMTEVAQQVLGHEISQRKLKLQPEEAPPTPPIPETPPDSPYAEERKLVEIRTVWSLSDALQLQTLLDTAGIPFYLGPEKATRVDPGTLNFVNGVSVQVMQVGLPWAHHAMERYTPANEPPAEKDEQQPGDVAIHCPKCHSTEVVFEGLDGDAPSATDNSSPKFEWICDSCGHRWEDEGVVTDE